MPCPACWLQSGPAVPIKPGNRLPLSEIPLGVPCHNIELVGRGLGGLKGF
jgi:ribosomal protein L2